MLVELEHGVDGSVEELAVVGDDDRGPVVVGEKTLQEVEAGEVEVVGRLVEKDHVEPR
jgi:hypothetical protein